MNILLSIILPLGTLFFGWFVRILFVRVRSNTIRQKAETILKDAINESRRVKKSSLIEAKEQILQERKQFEKELKNKRDDQQRIERRLYSKEDALDRKSASLEGRQKKLGDREQQLAKRELALGEQESNKRLELEKISGLTIEEAKSSLIRSIEREAHSDAYNLTKKIESEAKEAAEKTVREILLTTIQRLATDIIIDSTVQSVSLPNDEMKGRIIGKEGRNIRALETVTGVDIVIDDTPEAVVISCFDPVRRAIAKRSLEKLVLDGRIHPARIEEIVNKTSKEVNQVMLEEAEKVLYDLNIHNMPQEGVRALGRLYFRTSYGQNILYHSKEVALIAGLLAAELGLNAEICMRGALMHDIGKGLVSNPEHDHAEAGAELAKRLGEHKIVLQAIDDHHTDADVTSPELIVVKIADAISAARPGARREAVDSYIKRLENLERIANEFEGVDRVYAIQAGRELRVLVNSEIVDDVKSRDLAKSIAQKIEIEMQYPGHIKIAIIRETRAVEYAY